MSLSTHDHALSILHHIETQCLNRHEEIEAWFRSQWLATPPPFYSSVDLRNAYYKLAPIDTNLFPAGFNNLNPKCMRLAIQGVQHVMKTQYNSVSSVLIIIDSFTRHIPYFENVYVLSSILNNAGYTVKIGTILYLPSPKSISLSDGRQFTVYPVKKEDDVLSVEGFIPDLILLNDDLTAGSPQTLQHLSQPVTPTLELGWSHRRKSQHFFHYNSVADVFAKLIDIDPWLINPYFEVCHQVDFINGEGLPCLQKSIELVLEKTQQKYKEYQIEREPFVVVKADAGTYGMGITMVKSTDDIRKLNRKERSKMSQLKAGQISDQVLVQEGVYTTERIGESQAVGEPVAYLFGEQVVGGFYRLHRDKDVDENLNVPGMEFEPLAFHTDCISPNKSESLDAENNRLYVYGLIARLAVLAAARERK